MFWNCSFFVQRIQCILKILAIVVNGLLIIIIYFGPFVNRIALDQRFYDRFDNISVVLVEKVTVDMLFMNIFNDVPRKEKSWLLSQIDWFMSNDVQSFLHWNVLLWPFRVRIFSIIIFAEQILKFFEGNLFGKHFESDKFSCLLNFFKLYFSFLLSILVVFFIGSLRLPWSLFLRWFLFFFQFFFLHFHDGVNGIFGFELRVMLLLFDALFDPFLFDILKLNVELLVIFSEFDDSILVGLIIFFKRIYHGLFPTDSFI